MQSTLFRPAVLPVPRPWESTRAELGALGSLALPLVVANVGQVLIGAVDTAIVGRLGSVELAGAGLGNTIFFTVAVLGVGVLCGLDPLFSQAFGAGERRRAGQLLWQAVWLALLLSLPLGALELAIGFSLERVGIAPDVAQAARDYLIGRAPGLVPFLLFVGLRSFLQSAARTRPLIAATLGANAVNLVLGVLLAFGDQALIELGLGARGLPALGVLGAALAGTAATAFQALWLVLATRAAGLGSAPLPPRAAALSRVLALGAPVGAQMLAEFTAFAIVHLLIGVLDGGALAGHQLAITLASATFMVPLALGNAASVRVGGAVGRGDTARARSAGLVAIAVSAVLMSAAALALLLGPRALARLFTDQASVIAAAVPLLWIAALFQISDGVQAVAAGALRGAGDTRFPLLLNLAGHYGVGLPAGVVLALGFGLGARGLWWGLSLGLCCVASGLSLRFVRLTARPVARA
jgi:MATE family multidrug resistance protein